MILKQIKILNTWYWSDLSGEAIFEFYKIISGNYILYNRYVGEHIDLNRDKLLSFNEALKYINDFGYIILTDAQSNLL